MHTPGEGKIEGGVFKLHLNNEGVLSSRENLHPHDFSQSEQATNLDIPAEEKAAETSISEKGPEKYEAPKAFRDKINDFIAKGRTLRVFRELDLDILHSAEALAERLKRYSNPEIDGNLTPKEYEEAVKLLGIAVPASEHESVETDTPMGSFVTEVPEPSSETTEKENSLEAKLSAARDEYAQLAAQWQKTLVSKEGKYARTIANLDPARPAPKFEEPKELLDARKEYSSAKKEFIELSRQADSRFDENEWLFGEHEAFQDKKTEYIQEGSRKLAEKALDNFDGMDEESRIASGSNLLIGNFSGERTGKATYEGFRSPERKVADVLPFAAVTKEQPNMATDEEEPQEPVKEAIVHPTGIGFSGETFIEGIEMLKTEIKNLYANEPMPAFIKTNILNRPNHEIVQEFKQIPADQKIESGSLKLTASGNLVYKDAQGYPYTVLLDKKVMTSAKLYGFTGGKFIPEASKAAVLEQAVPQVPVSEPVAAEIAPEQAESVPAAAPEMAVEAETPKSEVGITALPIPFEKGNIQIIVGAEGNPNAIRVIFKDKEIASGPDAKSVHLDKGVKKGWILKTDEEEALDHIQPMLKTIKAK